MNKLVLSSILAASLVVACSSSSDSSSGGTADAGPTGSDSGTTGADSGTTGADSSTTPDSGGGTDAGTCGTAALEGAGVPEVAGVGALPTPAGGAVADGTWVLSKWEIYQPGTVDPVLRKQTFVFSAGTFAANSQNDTAAAKQNSGTFTSSGTTLSLIVACPAVGTVSIGYTATATELMVIQDNGSGKEVHTYTKK